ncbi:major pollen allergen Ole e 10, partial [Asparagus officinalis]|uniref:major pollen allergen Ole e 10 n=1 Tax=Asparagus officinalis TaxID=4686 RepID=UPI00098E7AD0
RHLSGCITPITTTTPAYNPLTTPTNPTLTITPPTDLNPNPYPATGNSGQSWCAASQSASETALQVGLDYACGYGGADCSEIQQGGSCFNPDTVRDHASYAFNSYYQKNPSQTSCDFGGTAIITNTDPSSSTCQYPSLSTSSSTLNTTNPIGGGSTVFGPSPPYTDTNSIPTSTSSSFTLIFFLISLIYLKVYK